MARIDRLRSVRNQAMKLRPSSTEKIAVLVYRLTSSLSVRMSVICVPTMLTSTTVNQ